jgi:NhaA family Na+:H+ antiporter
MNRPARPRNAGVLSLGSWAEARRIADVLRKETIGGALLLAATVAALVWANSPWAGRYDAMTGFAIGPSALHLHLPLATWAADGLLAIFFFVAGLELKREFVAGDLRDPRRAAVPVAAAVGGVIVPAVVYTLINLGGATRGWAIPTATDIAFALAVLAVVGRCLPTPLRTFLLTLAVVDDLLAILIIAVFYTAHLSVLPLVGALLPLAAFTWLVQRRVRSWWLLLPLAAATWALVHASGVHATVAGVLLGFAVPVLRRDKTDGPGLAEHFEHRFRPLSAGLAVPVFALMSAGVTIGGLSGLSSALTDPVAIGVMLGLVVGKPIGILTAIWATARFTRAKLAEGLAWIDMAGLAVLGGIGFTVSLLLGELAFGAGGDRDDHVKVAVLLGSLTAAALASIVLRLRNRTYRRLFEAEHVDRDGDSVPDVYQS